MKKIYTLFFGILAVATTIDAQTVFQSNLSSWAGGNPTDWMGSKTNMLASSVVEVTTGATYGTSMASLINATTSPERFTTKTVAVLSGKTYEIKMWISGNGGNIRTNYYNVTGATFGAYNSYVTATATQTLITQTVTLPTPCDSAQFILSLKNTDAVGIKIDSVYIGQTTPPTITPATIYNIQYSTVSPFNSPYSTQYVSTSGVVTGVQYNGYYLQDGNGAWNGIFVLDYTNVPNRGDVVAISGLVDEYFGFTTIKSIISYSATPGGTLPTPTLVTTMGANSEQYESVLVKINNANCIADTTSNTYREWSINDGSGVLVADDKMFIFAPTISIAYNVTGIMDYSFSKFKILPRDINDITVATGINELSNVKISVFPVPAKNSITFDLNINGFKVNIFDITGKTIITKSTSSNNKLTINTKALNNGVYFYTIYNDESVITTAKFIVAK